jgi:hypothetical protein
MKACVKFRLLNILIRELHEKNLEILEFTKKFRLTTVLQVAAVLLLVVCCWITENNHEMSISGRKSEANLWKESFLWWSSL